MSHVRSIWLKREMIGGENVFPFSVPAIRTLDRLPLDARTTFFVGENGTGKSTLLEALAAAADLPTVGSAPVALDATLERQRALGDAIGISWSRHTRRGLFLRAEDFFGHVRAQARDAARLVRERGEARGERPPYEGGAEHPDEIAAARYLEDYDAQSHGESFFELFQRRMHGDGLYLLDEPESPLSPQRQLALLLLLIENASYGAQFVIATHSPILLAFPGALIYSFDETPVAAVAYDSLSHVALTRDFLNDPGRYLRHLVAGDRRPAT